MIQPELPEDTARTLGARIDLPRFEARTDNAGFIRTLAEFAAELEVAPEHVFQAYQLVKTRIEPPLPDWFKMDVSVNPDGSAAVSIDLSAWPRLKNDHTHAEKDDNQ